MDGVHDLGGMHGFGPVVTPDGDSTHAEAWELRAQAIGLVSNTVSRARIEGLEPAVYLAASYYERWLAATEAAVVGRGQVAPDRLEHWQRRMASGDHPAPSVGDASADDPANDRANEITGRLDRYLGEPFRFESVAGATAFGVGEQVRVRRSRPARHHRCPRYVRGVVGTIERVCGGDLVPGVREAPVEPVYTVRFESVDLWGPGGEPPFVVHVDLWEHDLEVP